MTTYLVTAGAPYEVLKDGELLSGTRTSDAAAIQAAIADAADGDTIQLRNAASGAGAEGFKLDLPAGIVNAGAWAGETEYALFNPANNKHTVVSNGGKAYVCVVAGTAAASGGPTGTGNAIIDGTCTWAYLGTIGDNFRIGGAAGIVADKSLTFRGVNVDGKMAKISGGAFGFLVKTPGRNFGLYNIEFADWGFWPVYVGQAADVVVSGCKSHVPSILGRGYTLVYAGRNECVTAGFLVGGSGFPNGLTGDVLVEGNEVDLNADPSMVLPELNNSMSFGINSNVTEETANVVIKNNIVKNITHVGILTADSWGAVTVENNEVRMSPVHGLFYDPTSPEVGEVGDPSYHAEAAPTYHNRELITGRGVQFISGVFRTGLGDTPDAKKGSCTFSKNNVFVPQKDAVGISLYSMRGYKPGPIAAVGNTVNLSGTRPDVPFMAMLVEGLNYCYVGQNKFLGKSRYGFWIGHPSGDGEYNTDYNAFNGNNIKRLECLDVRGEDEVAIALYFTPDAHNNAFAGGGFSPETVMFTDGSTVNGNMVTGYAPIHGGLGDVLSSIIQAFHDSPAYPEPGWPTE